MLPPSGKAVTVASEEELEGDGILGAASQRARLCFMRMLLSLFKPPRLVHDPVLKTGVPRLRDKPLRPVLVWNEMFTERDRTFLHAHHMLQ